MSANLLAAGGYLESVATTFKDIVAIILPAFIGLVIIGFAYGLFLYVKGGAEDKEKGKVTIFWGALAVVVLLSIYGIAGLLQNIVGISTTTITVPTTPKAGGLSGNTSAPTFDPSAPGPDPFGLPTSPREGGPGFPDPNGSGG